MKKKVKKRKKSKNDDIIDLSNCPSCQWVNNHTVLWRKLIKPCWLLKFCPYGQVIEVFPITKKRSGKSCEVFGHDCPVFYMSEPFMEDLDKKSGKLLDKALNDSDKELSDWHRKKMNKVCKK